MSIRRDVITLFPVGRYTAPAFSSRKRASVFPHAPPPKFVLCTEMSPTFTRILNHKISLVFGADHATWLRAAAFLLFLFAFEAIHIGSGFRPLFEYVQEKYDPVEIILAVAYGAVAIYLFFILVLAAIASERKYQAIYIAVTALAVVLEYGYSKATGRFTNGLDVQSAISATQDQRVDAMMSFVDIGALIPIGVLLLICWPSGSEKARYGFRMFAKVVLINVIFYLHLANVNPAFFDRQFGDNSVGALFLTSAEYLYLASPIVTGPKHRQLVEVPADVPARPQNNIVMVFDESVRGDHLSLNDYERSTTPYLVDLKKKGLLLNMGIAVSASTMSHLSYDAFISGATPDEISSLGFSGINELPSIFQYAKAMNYTTSYFDGQMKGYWGGLPEDINYIDRTVTTKDLDSPDRVEDWEIDSRVSDEDQTTNQLKIWEIDRKIAKQVNEIFSHSIGNFVFIYKRGVHFPYEKNYPKTAESWQPVYHLKEWNEIPSEDERAAAINSYDNAIRFNLDAFFKSLAPDYQQLPNNTVILYTSDHGESLYANGKAGHGGKTRGEATVPFLLFGMNGSNVDTTFKATHANMFTTILDLMNYPVALRKVPYARSVLGARGSDSENRVFNPPPGEKVRFD